MPSIREEGFAAFRPEQLRSWPGDDHFTVAGLEVCPYEIGDVRTEDWMAGWYDARWLQREASPVFLDCPRPERRPRGEANMFDPNPWAAAEMLKRDDLPPQIRDFLEFFSGRGWQRLKARRPELYGIYQGLAVRALSVTRNRELALTTDLDLRGPHVPRDYAWLPELSSLSLSATPVITAAVALLGTTEGEPIASFNALRWTPVDALGDHGWSVVAEPTKRMPAISRLAGATVAIDGLHYVLSGRVKEPGGLNLSRPGAERVGTLVEMFIPTEKGWSILNSLPPAAQKHYARRRGR